MESMENIWHLNLPQLHEQLRQILYSKLVGKWKLQQWHPKRLGYCKSKYRSKPVKYNGLMENAISSCRLFDYSLANDKRRVICRNLWPCRYLWGCLFQLHKYSGRVSTHLNITRKQQTRLDYWCYCDCVHYKHVVRILLLP